MIGVSSEAELARHGRTWRLLTVVLVIELRDFSPVWGGALLPRSVTRPVCASDRRGSGVVCALSRSDAVRCPWWGAENPVDCPARSWGTEVPRVVP